MSDEALRELGRPDVGVLFVITGSSGTGKTTLLKKAFEVLPDVEFSVSATTRAPRRGEVDNVDYRFLDVEAFLALRDAGELLEWAEVYGNFYGTPRKPVEQTLQQGRSILLEIDVQGARQIKQSHPEAVLVFVLPPSLDVIEERLRGRSTDDEAIIARRVSEAMVQISACGEFDYLVVNGNLDEAHKVFQSVLISELCRTSRRGSLVRSMVEDES